MGSDGPVSLEVSHTVFQPEVEPGQWGEGGAGGLAVTIPLQITLCLCSDLELLGTSFPELHSVTDRHTSQAPQRTQSVFRRVLIQCKLIDVKVYSPCEMANSHSTPNAIIISCLYKRCLI